MFGTLTAKDYFKDHNDLNKECIIADLRGRPLPGKVYQDPWDVADMPEHPTGAIIEGFSLLTSFSFDDGYSEAIYFPE